MPAPYRLPEEYLLHRSDFTHARCAPCSLLVAWRAGPGTRLKDGPLCPSCGGRLARTCAALLSGRHSTVVEVPRFRAPDTRLYPIDTGNGEPEILRRSDGVACWSDGSAILESELAELSPDDAELVRAVVARNGLRFAGEERPR